jgi:pilus assembly protein FimV
VALNRTKVLEAAQKYLAKSQYDKAIAEYEKLVQEDPRDVRTLLKIGDLHTRRARPKDAVEVYNRVADLYAKQGFFLKAVAVYKQILKLVPGDLPTTERLGRMYEELALTNDALNTYEFVADAHLTHGNVARAIETMERMVSLDEQNVAARIKLAEGLSKADRKQEAASAFAAGAALLKEQGRMDDYVRVVERQLYHDPENVALSRELAAMYLDRNDAKRALAKLQPCFKADPRHVPTLELLAEAFSKLGQAPKTVSVLKEIARLHGEANDSTQRLATLRRIAVLDPSDNEAQVALRALEGKAPAAAKPAPPREPQKPEPRAARLSLEDAESLDDDELSLLSVDGESDDEGDGGPGPRSDQEDAVLLVDEDSTAEPAPSAAPQDRLDPDAWMEEAELLESEQRYDEAEALLQRVLRVVPEHEDAHGLLKDIYLATDRRVDAVRELLWLSDAFTESDLARAQKYALAAYRLAPHSDVTKNRLRALELESESASGPHAQPSAPDEAVMFVDDAPASEAPEGVFDSATARPSYDAPPTLNVAQEGLSPLDLPIDPDEFDAAPPRAPRAQRSAAELAALLDAPLSPGEFSPAARSADTRPVSAAARAAIEAERETQAQRERDSSPPARRSSVPPRPRDEVEALLDAPISPDDFDAPAHPQGGASGRTGPRGFDLASSDFDNSDLIAYRGEHRKAVLEVIDDVPSEPPLDVDAPFEAANEAPREAAIPVAAQSTPTGQAQRRSRGGSVFESDLLDELPDPTLPSEPIPDLLLQSQRPENARGVPLATPVFAPAPVVVSAPGPAPAIVMPVVEAHEHADDDVNVLDALSAELELVDAEPEERGASTLVGAEPEPLAKPEAQTEALVEPEVATDTALDFPAHLDSEEPSVADPSPTQPQPAAEQPAAEATARATDVSASPSGRPLWGPLPAEVEETLDEAEFFASQGMLEEALETVQEAMLIYPGTEALAAKLADYEAQIARRGRISQTPRDSSADESFDIAEQLATQLSEAHVPAGHDEMVDVESVFAQFKKGVAQQISPEDTETHFDLAIAYKEMGLIDDAISEFELASKSTRRACTALTMIAMCHVERGEHTRAVTYFERALASPQQAPSEELGLLFELGSTYEATGQLDKALKAFERVAIRDRTFRGVSGRVEQLRRKGASSAAVR